MALVTKNFSDIITFTRASTGTFFNSSGVLTSAAVDQPRFDYNPSTLAAQGLLIEEARTNIVASSVYTANTNGWTNGVLGGTGIIVAAAVNSPSGTTAGVFNISGLNGSSYVGQFATVTASANARTGSVFVRNNGGVKFQIRLIFQTGGTFVSYGTEYDFNTTAFQDGIAGTTAPTSRSVTNVGNGWLRITITASDNGTGNTQASLQFWGAATTTNYNYLMWGAQIEEASAGASAAFPTSYIHTTTTALTRSADVASVNTLSPWFNSAEYTLFHEGMVLTNNDGIVYSGVGDTFDNTTYFSRSAPNELGIVRSGAALVAQMTVNTTPSSGVPFKMAMKVKANDFAFCVNGGSVATDTSGAVPVSTVRLGIGNAPWTASGGNARQQWVRRITFYPRGLSAAELQTITT